MLDALFLPYEEIKDIISISAEYVGSDDILGEKVTVKLAPYQAALIKITPDVLPDYSQLSDMSDTGGYEWAEDAINFMYDEGIANADVQGNSNGLNVNDVIAISKYALKLINTLPIN